MIRIVSDGGVDVKLFDESGQDITSTAGRGCTGIDIQLEAGDFPRALFMYRSVELDITAEKIDDFEDPIVKQYYWRGKRVQDMTAEDIKECRSWCDRNPGEDKVGFIDAVLRRLAEL